MPHGQSLIMNGEIILSGYVIADGDACWFDDDCGPSGYFWPSQVREALSMVNGRAVLRLNSAGGDPYAGEAIRAMLAQHPGGVEVIVEGVAASAASLLFMGGARRVMSAGSMLMIHDPQRLVWANEDEMRRQADLIRLLADTYAAVYGAAAGMSAEKVRKLMKAETWFNAAEAVASGFAHAVQADLAQPAGTATDAAAMSLDVARAQFSTMQHGMAVMAARKNSGAAAPGPSAAAGGSPALMAISEEAVMPNETPAAVTAATPAPVAPVVAIAPVAPATMALTPEMAVQKDRQNRKDVMTMAAPFMASGVLTAAEVEAVIDAGTPAGEAGQKFMAIMAAAQPPVSRSQVSITRDEVDTRRTGMRMALEAQFSRATPADDRARPYMVMTLVEMAAAASGYKGPLRTAGDKINALMAGTHTTSDFTGIFENALNKALLDRYQVHQPTYRKIARKKNFNDFRVHPMVRAGDFPNLLPIGEGGEIKFGTFGEKRETAILSPYGVGLNISRQMFINDDTGAISDLINDYGSRVAMFEEATFYAFMAAATLASDSAAIWVAAATRGATAAGNLTSSGTAITVAALGIGQAVLRTQKGIESSSGAADGIKLNLTPKILLVSPTKEVEALQYVTAITPAAASNVNVFTNKLEVVVSAELSGNGWYLFADPNLPGGQCFVYGYLNGAEAPRLRTDEPFGVQGWSMTLEHDFGLGAVDFRGTYKNAGA